MNIIIPMAGMGKRMRPHSLTTPKPLIPIAGKPIVHRIVEEIAASANEPIETIAFICGRFGEQAEKDLIAVAEKNGAKGIICYQDNPLGTAHAILCAKEALNGKVFIALADTLFDAQFSINSENDAIIWVHKVQDPSAFGVITLNEDKTIKQFVEKPKEFISDLAIIGVYYFKDGENLKKELQYLLDNDIKNGNEYQITAAMENMKQKGLAFHFGEVREWLDCGNVEAVLNTNARILALKQGKEQAVHPTAKVNNSTIIQPCFVGEGVELDNSVIGPNVSIEAGAKLTNCIIKDSIIRDKAQLNDVILTGSMIGSEAKFNGKSQTISIGDHSTTV